MAAGPGKRDADLVKPVEVEKLGALIAGGMSQRNAAEVVGWWRLHVPCGLEPPAASYGRHHSPRSLSQ
jgi:hypothetical protein